MYEVRSEGSRSGSDSQGQPVQLAHFDRWEVEGDEREGLDQWSDSWEDQLMLGPRNRICYSFITKVVLVLMIRGRAGGCS